LTEENIQRLFGHEAAEDENPERLREYYFKTEIYNQFRADLPLRILVGHKGIGKSALIKVAMLEDEDNKCLPILIRPDDITGIGKYGGDFLEAIRDWKKGLAEIIAEKVLKSLGWYDNKALAKLQLYGGRLVSFLNDTFKEWIEIDEAPAKRALVETFLKRQRIHVYIDDLDRGWESKSQDIKRISAMLNAVRDMCNANEGLRVRIALRSDVYYLVRTSDESTDKIEGSVIWQSWTNHEIFVMLVKRVRTFFGNYENEASLVKLDQRSLAPMLHVVMEPRFSGSGHWDRAPMHRVIMSLVRKRPRDLVKLCTLAARRASVRGASIIATQDFLSVFEEYSQGRMQDTINEFRSELPNIERLLFGMKPNKYERRARANYTYATDKLLAKVKSIMEQGTFRYSTGEPATAKTLAQFLYKINFLTATKNAEDGMILRKYFEENRYLFSEFVDFGFDWEVHPAYRWALQPDNIGDIFSRLQLSVD
jgi:hypothetical protein